MFVTGVLQQIMNQQPMTLVQQGTYSLIGFLIFLAMNGYLLMKRGQTIGKVAVGTRIVDLAGRTPEFGKLITLRYLVPALVSQIPCAGALFGLANALCIFGSERRCLHDYIAGTRVINA
jgi:uncharacterized RDD family membrane protein YckC